MQDSGLVADAEYQVLVAIVVERYAAALGDDPLVDGRDRGPWGDEPVDADRLVGKWQIARVVIAAVVVRVLDVVQRYGEHVGGQLQRQ